MQRRPPAGRYRPPSGMPPARQLPDLDNAQSAGSEELTGTIDRLVYRDDKSGYVVARFHLDGRLVGRNRQITIAGTLPGISAGEAATVAGQWKHDPRYGATFMVANYEPHLPTTAAGIEVYLGSGVLRGVGSVTASRIVAQFGEHTLDVLDNHPEELAQVKGISPRKATAISEAWTLQKDTRALALFLQKHSISPLFAGRMYERYGTTAIEVATHTPYQLETDITGIGFRTADALARSLGLPEHSPERTGAGIRFALSEASGDGHCYLPVAQLVEATAQLLSLPKAEIEQELPALQADRRIIVEDGRAYLPALHVCEAGLALRLHLLTRTSQPVGSGPLEIVTAEIATATGLILSSGQIHATRIALASPLSIITGGPGTGKTTALRGLIAVLKHRGVPFALAAPTGRAARRLSDLAGCEATTIHRLLELAPGEGTPQFNPDRPLPIHFLVVDECSMLDVVLAYHLCQALPPHAQLLLVGDVDQLPSVGPGNVLRDLIDSGVPAVAHLTELFRQAAESAIIANARRILAGQMPVTSATSTDFYVVAEDLPERAASSAVRLVAERIPARFKLDPVADVQVLSPVLRGAAGVLALNTALQQALNARNVTSGVSWGGAAFALGDKVMQVRNNYDRGVYNGDIGIVTAVDAEERTVEVSFDIGAETRTCFYEQRDLDELMLAYAATVHKAQGSEYPAIVLLLLHSHGLMLRRDLLYTAVTRAKHLCVIVGSLSAIARAVATNDPEARNTWLKERLQVFNPLRLSL